MDFQRVNGNQRKKTNKRQCGTESDMFEYILMNLCTPTTCMGIINSSQSYRILLYFGIQITEIKVKFSSCLIN
jgi:hypothetical protein